MESKAMSPLTIMLVDDSSICNLIMRKVLSHLPITTDIRDFTDPVYAFSQLSALHPSLIFLDLNMPELDGWGFLERMRETGQRQPVIILTSSTSTIDRSRCDEFSNVLFYQNKPVTAAFVDVLSPLLQEFQAKATPPTTGASGTTYPAQNSGAPII
ncbi:response regulator [Fibrella sp. WM1]|uniref:response regulator n=1 Tax=Fibrella musci TaxID=3242485 RepID=UPI00351F9413